MYAGGVTLPRARLGNIGGQGGPKLPYVAIHAAPVRSLETVFEGKSASAIELIYRLVAIGIGEQVYRTCAARRSLLAKALYKHRSYTLSRGSRRNSDAAQQCCALEALRSFAAVYESVEKPPSHLQGALAELTNARKDERVPTANQEPPEEASWLHRAYHKPGELQGVFIFAHEADGGRVVQESAVKFVQKAFAEGCEEEAWEGGLMDGNHLRDVF
jgi:hypothetical protein